MLKVRLRFFDFMSIKNIVFDFGNVIGIYDPVKILEGFSLSDEERELFIKEIFEDPLWREADRGCSYRDVLFYDKLKELPERLRSVFFSSVARYDFEAAFMPQSDGIEELIKELKQNGYGIYLLSNIGLGFHILRLKRSIFSLFDGTFATCDYGMLKPEEEVYEAFLERFSLLPAECIFIDDSPENVKAGINAGMSAFTYNALYEDISRLREKLREYGIKSDS